MVHLPICSLSKRSLSPSLTVSLKHSWVESRGLQRIRNISKLCGKIIPYSFKLRKTRGMVFCYQNCSDLRWEKIVLAIEKNFWYSRLKAENLQKVLDHLNNLFKQWKVRTIFGNRMILTCSWKFLMSNKLDQ